MISHHSLSNNYAIMPVSSITLWFFQLYHDLGLTGCSSHSGRRTFITRAARNIIQAGGSLRDVQQLAGHSSLNTTQRYIEGDNEAKPLNGIIFYDSSISILIVSKAIRSHPRFFTREYKWQLFDTRIFCPAVSYHYRSSKVGSFNNI